jgi:hypothetical protein
MDAPVVLVDAAFLLAHALFFCPVVLVYPAVVLIGLSFNALPFLAVELIHLPVVRIDLPTMPGFRLPDRTFVGSSIHLLGLSSAEDELVFVLRMSSGGVALGTTSRRLSDRHQRPRIDKSLRNAAPAAVDSPQATRRSAAACS